MGNNEKLFCFIYYYFTVQVINKLAKPSIENSKSTK